MNAKARDLETSQAHSLGAYREFRAPADLRDVVEALWMHLGGMPSGGPEGSHRVVSDAGVSLCFSANRSGEGRPRNGMLILLGPVWRVRFYEPAAGERLEAVRIKPEWTREILGAAPGEHVDALDDFCEVNPGLGRPLLSKLASTCSSSEAIRCLVRFVRERREHRDAPTATLLAHEALGRLRRRPGSVDLGELAGCLGVSARHLRRVVGAAAGISPKRFERVQRFHRSLRAADAARRPDWVRIAADGGYADQPHLIREFREFCGAPPSVVHRERLCESSPDVAPAVG